MADPRQQGGVCLERFGLVEKWLTRGSRGNRLALGEGRQLSAAEALAAVRWAVSTRSVEMASIQAFLGSEGLASPFGRS